jgi:6-phosphogluconolactonase (cycloisomerase 2 family)
MNEKSTGVQPNESTRASLPPVSRREFLAGAVACAVAGPALVRAAVRPSDSQTLLHAASHNGNNGYVHTYALTSGACKLLGATAVDSCAALAVHPLLPVLYLARDCNQWENLPRGVVETYAVERDAHPLRRIAQTPMALSATGPRSLAVSSCGRHLLVSASTGGAWNAFALDHDGVPAGVAIARKETGPMVHSHPLSLPTPHGLVFSPHAPLAIGTDPGSERMTLLQPSPEAIAVLARHQMPYGLTPASPVWTSDGRYLIAANARNASLYFYEIQLKSGDGSNAGIHLLSATPTATPVTALVAHPTQLAVFTARPHGHGSRLELWKTPGSDLRLAGGTWVSGHIVALAEHDGDLWAASHDRLIRIPADDLRSPFPFEAPLPISGVHAIVTQNLAGRHLNNL